MTKHLNICTCGGSIQVTTPEQTVKSGSSSQLDGEGTCIGLGKGLMAAIHHTLYKMEQEQAGTKQGLYLDNILHCVAEF